MFQHFVADLVMSRALPVLQVSEATSQLPEAEGAAGVLFVATAFLLEDCPGLSGGRTVLAALFHSRDICIDLAEQVRLLTICDSSRSGWPASPERLMVAESFCWPQSPRKFLRVRNRSVSRLISLHFESQNRCFSFLMVLSACARFSL